MPGYHDETVWTREIGVSTRIEGYADVKTFVVAMIDQRNTPSGRGENERLFLESQATHIWILHFEDGRFHIALSRSSVTDWPGKLEKVSLKLQAPIANHLGHKIDTFDDLVKLIGSSCIKKVGFNIDAMAREALKSSVSAA
jgi:hypothetical protein